MGNLVPLIIQMISGALGGQLLKMLGVAPLSGPSTDLSSVIGNIATGGAGGGVLMAIIGVIKKALCN